MKRIIILILVFSMIVALFPATVAACDSNIDSGYSAIEYLENGDYIVTEFVANCPRSLSANSVQSTKSGAKIKTYYAADGTKIWNLTVNGSFSYTYGVSATATSASAIVNIYSPNATFVRKNAYTSGNAATATGTVRYGASDIYLTVSVSCDKYGNLS